LDELEAQGLVELVDRVPEPPYLRGVLITPQGEEVLQRAIDQVKESLAPFDEWLAKQRDVFAPMLQRFKDMVPRLPSSAFTGKDLSFVTEQITPLSSEWLTREPYYEIHADDRDWTPISPDLGKLPIREDIRDTLEQLIQDVDRAHANAAYISATLLYRSIIETLLLGLLLNDASRAMDPNGKCVPKDKQQTTVIPIEEWGLQQMIQRAVAMGLMDRGDEASLKVLQEYGNLTHTGRVLRTQAFRSPPEDAVIARAHLVRLLKRYGALPE